jgi:hypothetical protein
LVTFLHLKCFPMGVISWQDLSYTIFDTIVIDSSIIVY